MNEFNRVRDFYAHTKDWDFGNDDQPPPPPGGNNVSGKPTDTATVNATYATAATFMQSPSPTRVERFERWLNEVQAQAWDESAEKACGDNWLPDTNGNPGRPNLSDMKRLNPYRKGN